MRLSTACFVVLGVAIILSASGEARADVLFSDDFNRDDGPPEGWLTPLGLAEIRDQELVVESVVGSTEVWTWIDTTEFEGDVIIQFDVHFDPSDATPEVGRHGGIMFCASEKTDRYSPTMTGYVMDWIDRTAAPNDYGYRFHKWTNGAEVPLIPDGSAPDPDIGEEWRITISGETIVFEADNVVKGIVDDEEYRLGSIGFWGWSNGQHIHIDNLVVSEPPIPRITATPSTGPAPLTVSFDGSASSSPGGAITSYEWSFGDGMTGTGAMVNHTYSDVGIYAAQLWVTDASGGRSLARAKISAGFPAGDVSPWTSSDVGSPALPGGARFVEGGCIEVFASGKEILATADHFHFVHQPLSGDGTLTTRLKEILTVNSGMRGGVMLRDSLDPDSAFGMLAVQATTTGVRTIFLSRSAQGDRVLTRTTPFLAMTPPDVHLRLARSGADLVASASGDGQSWMEINKVTLAAPMNDMLGGLAVTATDRFDEGLAVDWVFCDTTLEGSGRPPPNKPESLTATPGDGQVALAWDEPLPGEAFTGYSVSRDGTSIAELLATERTYTDTGLENGVERCYRVFATRGATRSPPSDEACATPAAAGGAVFHRGDADNNGQLQLTDAVRILGFLFLGGAAPTCLDAGDADDNGQLQLTDAVRILGFLFLGGAEPAAPGPPPAPCGVDPTGDDALGCEVYTSC